MIKILEQTQGNIIATRATEKLTEADYHKILPLAKNLITQHNKIRWYFEFDNFEGWNPKALWEDIKFDATHVDDFEKVAIVGEKKWEEWMTQGMKPFTSAEIKYFDTSQREEALQWIKN